MTRAAARWPRVVIPAAVVGAAVWSISPAPIWWAGTDGAALWGVWRTWLWGTLVAVGVTVLVAILGKDRVVRSCGRWWRHWVLRPSTSTFLAVAAAMFAGLALACTFLVFSANPRNVDGFAQLFQARMFLEGRLWVPPPAEIAHFATLHMIVGPARWFSQYPPGQTAVLAAGLVLGAWWVLNPAFAVALLVATHRVARWCVGEGTARLVVVLLCLSPFAVAVAGSEMNHLPGAALGVGAAACATALGGRRWAGAALASGALLGVMTAFRPLDAIAASVPVAAIALFAARRRVPAFGAIVAGGVVGTLPTLWYNARVTGSWHEFGYTYLWGPNHSLGFHAVPWGIALTPLRALGLTALDLHQLNVYLLDFPFPVLLLVAAGYAVGRWRLTARDAVPVAAAGALIGLLFFYWHRDVFYGPRLLFSVVPWLLVLVGRALMLLRGPDETPSRGAGVVTLGVAVALAIGLVGITPARLAAYRSSTPTLNHHPDRAAARAGITHAIVVLPDGWGSRLIARMWADGVPVRRSTRLYGGIDACTLQRSLDRAEATGSTGDALVAALETLAARGQPGVPVDLTADRNLRLLPGGPLDPVCRAEIAFDREGFLAFAPYLYLNTASLDGPIIWARDLRDNEALRRRYPDRPLYRYAPVPPAGKPAFVRLAEPLFDATR